MILAKSKAQVMVLDVLILLIITLLIINIEYENINLYKININNSQKELKLFKEEVIANNLINDCNYLAKLDASKVCYSNVIDVKDTDYPLEVCQVAIGDNIIYYIDKNISNSIVRGIIYNNQFKIIEVGFCD